MKRLHFAPILGLLALAGAAAAQSADARPPAAPRPGPNFGGTFVQVSVFGPSRGKAAVGEVAIASLPGDPLIKFDIDGDRMTVTHYCR